MDLVWDMFISCGIHGGGLGLWIYGSGSRVWELPVLSSESHGVDRLTRDGEWMEGQGQELSLIPVRNQRGWGA